MSDTGESTAAIRARSDDAAWPRISAGLERGLTLLKPAKIDSYYLANGSEIYGGAALSRRRVRTLEDAGVLRNVGEHRYALAEGPRP